MVHGHTWRTKLDEADKWFGPTACPTLCLPTYSPDTRRGHRPGNPADLACIFRDDPPQPARAPPFLFGSVRAGSAANCRLWREWLVNGAAPHCASHIATATLLSPFNIPPLFEARENFAGERRREEGEEKKRKRRRRTEERGRRWSTRAMIMAARLVTEFHGRRVIFRVIG